MYLIDDDLLTKKILEKFIKMYPFPISLNVIDDNFKNILNTSISGEIIFISLDSQKFDAFDFMSKNPENSYILLTQYDDFYLAKKALRFRAVDILLKPIRFTELLEPLEFVLKAKTTGDKIIDSMLFDIEKMYMHNLTIKEFAEKFYMKPSNLSRLFKKKVKINFNDYLWDIRFKNFIYYLKNSDENIKSIINKVYYSDESNFYKKFYQRFNMTPQEYKKFIQTDIF
ncbi:helix-turn-helix domain-containing protein [Peptoniphilus sp.]|jgi:two-component system response regulator YesN|uniref:helix-turn-helix domain-containing protein n=1 Tax=Peptoniphilus sp. TaxID=1971214 RepID=UPI003D8C9C8B